MSDSYLSCNEMTGARGLRLQLVGLGDVGGTLCTGLRLLGGGVIAQIGIFDPDERRMSRYEQELNQILPLGNDAPRVVKLDYDALFTDCDAFLFTASVGVPPVGSGVADVRMAQYEKNRAILRPYAELAVAKQFSGLFFQVSDPVDRLCLTVSEAGFAPTRIIGCGLGVMLARADYYARLRGMTDFLARGRVYGPHGAGLIVANATDSAYDDALSCTLTQETLTANLAVRETGFKPYLAPGLSSGCITVLHALTGAWFDGAIYYEGIYFGCRARLTATSVEHEPLPEHPLLRARIDETLAMLALQRSETQI